MNKIISARQKNLPIRFHFQMYIPQIFVYVMHTLLWILYKSTKTDVSTPYPICDRSIFDHHNTNNVYISELFIFLNFDFLIFSIIFAEYEKVVHFPSKIADFKYLKIN